MRDNFDWATEIGNCGTREKFFKGLIIYKIMLGWIFVIFDFEASIAADPRQSRICLADRDKYSRAGQKGTMFGISTGKACHKVNSKIKKKQLHNFFLLKILLYSN